MKNILIGGVVGGVLLFLWGWVAWTVLPLHDASLRSIENEERVTEAMTTTLGTHGVYLFPRMAQDSEELSPEEQQAAMDEWQKKYQQGPRGMIIYDPHGGDPAMSAQMIPGFVINLLTAMLAVWFLSRSTAASSSFMARVSYCGMLGVFISFATHLVNWNWMEFPLDYTTAMIIDALLGWLIAGAGIAAVVKTRPAAKEA